MSTVPTHSRRGMRLFIALLLTVPSRVLPYDAQEATAVHQDNQSIANLTTFQLLQQRRQWRDMGRPWAFEKSIVTTCAGSKVGDRTCAQAWIRTHKRKIRKPVTPMNGVVAMAASARRAGSALPIMFVSFVEEREAHEECVQNAELSRLNVTCFLADPEIDEDHGYGYAKISALLAAPAREVLWIDDDAIFVDNPDLLFDDTGYTATGALFWGDLFDFFEKRDDELWGTVACGIDYRLYDCAVCDRMGTPCIEARDFGEPASCACKSTHFAHRLDFASKTGATIFRSTDWAARQGFDSGLFLIDKSRTMRELALTHRLASSGETTQLQKWAGYSMGDKDLWHLSWMLTGTLYAMSPFVGMVGQAADPSEPDALNYQLVSQAKLDAKRRVVVLHQNWRRIYDELRANTALSVFDLREFSEKPPFSASDASNLAWGVIDFSPFGSVTGAGRSTHLFGEKPSPDDLLDAIERERGEWEVWHPNGGETKTHNVYSSGLQDGGDS